MPFKVTWIFDGGSYGWTESLWNNGNSFSAVASRADAVANVRRAFMPPVMQISTIRVQEADAPRSVQLITGPYAGTGSPTVYNGAWPFEAVLVRLNTAVSGIFGRLFLRPAPAVPSSLWPNPRAIPAQWFVDSGPWVSTVLNPANEWAVRGVPASQPISGIVGIPNVAGGVLTITLATAIGVAVGSRIRVGRTIPADCHLPLNGVYIVDTYNAGTRVLTARVSLSDRTGQFDTGQVRVITPAYAQLQTIFAQRIVSHRTGRPFGTPRGRRSRKKVCR